MGIDDTVKAKPAAAPAPVQQAPQPAPQIQAANPVRKGPAEFRKDISKGIISPKPVASPYFKEPERGFWENPQRIARYHNLIRTAQPDWQAPPWLNVDAVKEAYDYMRFRNDFKPVEEWRYLPKDDPGSYFLKDLQAPPNEFLLPGEYGYKLPTISTTIPSQSEIDANKPVNWDALPLYQQILIAALTPEAGLEGRPEWTRATAAAGQALLAAPAGAAIGEMVGGPWAAAGLGLLTFGGTMYQAYTGTEIPGLNDFLQLMDTGAIFAERVIGLGKISGEKGLAELLAVLPEAYKAGGLTYETQMTDLVNKLGPAISGPLDWMYKQGWISEGGGWQGPAGEDEVWQFQEGFIDPQKLEGERGVAALLDAAGRIKSGEKYDDVYADYVDRFGFTGTLNDFIMQTAIDPANLAPGIGGRAGEVISRAVGNERAALAFKVNQGSLIVDAMPFPLQPFVTAVTGLHGAKGITQSWKTYKDWIQQGYYPASMFDLPKDMRTQFNKLVDQGVEPKTIQVNENKMLWTDKAGKTQEFVGSRKVMVDIPDFEQLSNFERIVGGIDPEYGTKEFRPSIQKSGINRLLSLDPASQSHLLLNTYHTVVANLFARAAGDPLQMGKMIKQLMGQERVRPGDPGEMILKSPAARAVRDAVRAAANTAGFENMLADWQSVAGGTAPDGSHIPGRRDILLNISRALNETPADILQQLQDNPDVLMTRINAKAPTAGNAEYLKKALGVFIGDDALPWNEQLFELKLVNSIADKMGEYMQKVYGLKPDKGIFRIAQTLKAVQSLVLLNFNPAYFLNNELNNMATRAATGVFGYMTQRQINQYWDRYGAKPPRLDVGASPADEGATYRPDMISKLKEADDTLGKVSKVVTATTRKLGVFSKLSADFESIESRNAFTIGTKQFMGRAWKRGKGFRKMHPAVERVLDQNFPGMKEMLYAAVEGGLNIREINDAIFGEIVKPSVRASAQAAAAQVFPNYPDVGMDLLEKSGVLDEIEHRVEAAVTPEDIDAAYRSITQDLRSIVDEKWQSDIIAAAEHARTLTEAERIPAVRELMVQFMQRQASLWLGQRKQWDDLYSKRDQMTAEQWSMQVESLFNQQDQEWRSHYKVQNQTYAGIAKALSVDAKASMDYLSGLKEVSDTWTKFHEDARKLRSDFFRQAKRKAGEDYEAYRTRSSRLWNTLQDTLDELYQKHASVEDKTEIRMDSYLANGFALYTGWNPVRVQAWRAYVRALRTDMVRMQRDHRRKTRNMDNDARAAAYADFNPVYNKLIADMHRAEILGAAWIRTQPVNSETLQSAITEIKKMVQSDKTGIVEPEPSVSPDPNAEFITDQGEGHVRVSMDWLAVRDAAIAADMIDKNGNVPTPFLLNVINVHLKANGKPEATRQNMYNQSPDVVLKAIAEHVERHQGDVKKSVKKQAGIRATLDDIARIAEADKREAYIKQKSYLTRRQLREKLMSVEGATPEQVDAAIYQADLYADQYMRRLGYTPSEATRDAWYATRIADIIRAIEEQGGGHEQVIADITPYLAVKGQNLLLDDGRSLLVMSRGADFSTIVHELAHIWRRDLSDADIDTLAKLGGLKDAAELRAMEQAFHFGEAGTVYKEWRGLAQLEQRSSEQEARLAELSTSASVQQMQKYVEAEELFTRGLERYYTEGFAPTPELRSVFKRFTAWMLDIYKTLYKKHGRVYGFESGDLSVNIRAEINGVNLRDIYDRMLVGEQVQRTPTFDNLVRNRVEAIKSTGRNIDTPPSELTRRAKREVVSDILSAFASLEQAIDYANAMQGDVFVTETGIELDAADLWDAIQAVKLDQFAYDPFTARVQEKQYASVAQRAQEVEDEARRNAEWRKNKQKAEPGKIEPEPIKEPAQAAWERNVYENMHPSDPRYWYFKDAKLPTEYAKETVLMTIRQILGELPEGNVTIVDADGNFTRSRGGAGTWYWSEYDALADRIKTLRAERVYRSSQLKRAKSDVRKTELGRMDADIRAAKNEAGRLHSDYQNALEWLQESIEKGQIRASKSERVNEFRSGVMQFVLDRAVTPGETYIPPGTPESEYLNLHMLYDMGQKEELLRVLSENGEIENWGFEDWERRGLTSDIAQEISDLFLTDYVTKAAAEPEITTPFEQVAPTEEQIIEQEQPAEIAPAQERVQQKYRDIEQANFDSGAAIDFDVIEKLGLQLTAAPVIEGVQPGGLLSEGDMPPGLHVHRLTAGKIEAGTEIAAIVYNDDLPVALIPTGADIGAFKTAHGQGRVLGLDMYNPVNWVIERDGEITVFDPNDLDVKNVTTEQPPDLQQGGLYQVDADKSFKSVPSELHKWAKIAIDHFGVTNNIHEAGYILPDGTMLDLTGRHYATGYERVGDRFRAQRGQPDYVRGTRSVDHRELPDTIYDQVKVADDNRNNLTMLQFMKETGAVRVSYDAGLINIVAPITTEQAFILRDYYSDGWMEVDNPDTGRSILNQEFEGYGKTQMRALLYKANAVAGGSGLYQVASPRQMRYGTPEFKAWFKDSKVVKENGQPLDLFHGTTRVFDEFDIGQVGTTTDEGWFGRGFYFTPDPVMASGYAVGYAPDNQIQSGPVMPVHLSIQKPFDFRHGKIPAGVEVEQGRFGIQPSVKQTTPGQFRDALIREGFDGVFVYEDLVYDPAGASDELYYKVLQWYKDNRPGVPFERSWLDNSLKKGIRFDYAVDYYGEELANQMPKINKLVEVVAFSPEQIKSKFNRGTWGGGTGNILQQTAPASKPFNPIGDVQPGSVPAPEPAGAITQEAVSEYMNPLINRMFEHYKANTTRKFKFGDLDPVSQKEVKTWINQVENDLSSTKLAGMRYGEQMRDFSLLNYSRRYGFDQYLNIGFPYIFWYMRSMMNWGARAFDRPAWFAMYARLRRKQEEQERKGMPSRLRGKVRIPLSWMPDFMGGGIYVDPMKQFFPPAQFGAPLDYAAQQQNQLQRRTEQVLRDMVEADSITQGDMDEALSTQAGSAWERAFTQAKMETEIDDSPMTLAGMLMQPALWWTIPSKLASGKGAEISPLPITRFGQSVRTALQDTPLEAIGNLAGAVFAGPEEAIREKAGLSKYGEWGDYYVDRQITNLVADGEVSVEDGLLAMNERRGAAYDMAMQRVQQEMMLRTPGTLPILAIKEGAHPVEVAAAVIASLFPAGLFPSGELKMRGLAAEYNAAWKRFDAGDEEAINTFFEKYPEYEARLALYDEPEERLRQFLVGEIWDRYTSLVGANRKRAVNMLGEEFEQSFLNKETRSYDSTDIKQLAVWAQMLGAQVPQVEATTDLPQGEPIELYTPGEVGAIDAYYKERDKLYPMAVAWQSAYYSKPAGAARKEFIAQHPQLRKYWDWNTGYKADHPEIQPYLNEQAEQRLNEDINDLSAPLTRQLITYFLMGKEMTGGAQAELNRIWISNGSKGGSLEEYMRMLVNSMFGQ